VIVTGWFTRAGSGSAVTLPRRGGLFWGCGSGPGGVVPDPGFDGCSCGRVTTVTGRVTRDVNPTVSITTRVAW
jgi:hypothetical protein